MSKTQRRVLKTLIAMLIIIIAAGVMQYSQPVHAGGAGDVTVTYRGNVFSYYADGSRPAENKYAIFSSSKGRPIFCGEHGVDTPMGEVVGAAVNLTAGVYDNSTIRKVLYYGYGGPAQWSGFSDPGINGVYSASGNNTYDCGIAITSAALTESYPGGAGARYQIAGLSSFLNFIAGQADPKSTGFTAFIVPGGAGKQDLFTWEYELGTIALTKTVADNQGLVNACPNIYTLQGAVYTVYNGSGTAVATLTTNAAGQASASVPAGNYTVKETTPPAGYSLDPATYSITVPSGGTAAVNSADKPKFDPMTIVLQKARATGSDDTLPLEGAEYTVKYYSALTNDVSALTAERTWIFRTDENGKVKLGADYKIGGDDYYYNADGDPVGLIGTYAIEETKAPAGYERTEGTTLVQVTPGNPLVSVTDYNYPTFEEYQLPNIGTYAAYSTGEKNALPEENLIVIDEVSYDHVIPGKPYQLKGELIDPDTDQVIATAETFFTPDQAEGIANVTFTFDGTAYKNGKSLVVYESLYRTDRVTDQLVASHKDKTDKNQTVTIPKIGTTATDQTNEEDIHNNKVTIHDNVSYTGLTPGKEYTVIGSLMSKKTGEAFKDKGGNEITVVKKFTPTTEDGTITIAFVVDEKLLRGEKVVVFENVYREDVLIAVHADINDEGQTVDIPNDATMVFRMAGTRGSRAATGDTTASMPYVVAITGSLVLILLFFTARKKKTGR